jgi:polyferredoxin
MDLQGQNGLLSTYREGYRRRGAAGIVIAVVLIGFYLVLYFEDSVARHLGFRPLSPLAESLGLMNRWYLYGALYTLAMVAGGAYYLKRHGNSRYNRIRIGVNVAVQALLAFTLPFWMAATQGKDFYFSYLWPLKIEYLYPSTLQQWPAYIAVYSLGASFVATPVLAYFFGKRWYCSWVCGCGGLANTFGDPFRHLTPTTERSWRFEQVTVHSVMVIAFGTTAVVAADFFMGPSDGAFHGFASELRSWYGLVVGAILAGVVGVGFYPLLGPRVWCRNFCPMAAVLGLLQKLGRFRIRVKPDMCISCGNCSAYCEMGIDVRAYAQRNESFTRAACVGCGMCAHVCPRGVLKLENAPRRAGDAKRSRLPVVTS